jgi:GNAT superfamily N-acetyltransferase
VDLRVERLTPERESDFVAFMQRNEDGAWCWCSAWWTPTWEGFGDRTAEQNRGLRDSLFADGIHDGYLAYAAGAPIGWMQAGPRDRLTKVLDDFDLPAEEGVWAVTCFNVLAPCRGQGVARRLLATAVEDAKASGATAVEGYPRHGTGHEPGEVWTGPESLFLGAGFTELSRGPRRAVWRLDLHA